MPPIGPAGPTDCPHLVHDACFGPEMGSHRDSLPQTLPWNLAKPQSTPGLIRRLSAWQNPREIRGMGRHLPLG